MGLFFLQGDKKGNQKVEIPDCHIMSSSSNSSSGPDEMDSQKQGDDEIVEHGSSPGSIKSMEAKNSELKTICVDSSSKITVKATYKEDTVQFKFEPSVGCFQLCEQVAQRFKIQNGSFRLNYLDDEEEWVMLVSDSDLYECLEMLVCRITKSQVSTSRCTLCYGQFYQ
ncbi:protein NLP8-like [Hibiscus syriacus]|uniref:protein NLP8-like n=1 Tax=Hibiscus syriacus TaxID=106335 RepID=UPI001922BE82|nr:protein NLP8-like [Hibiscus syriacus]